MDTASWKLIILLNMLEQERELLTMLVSQALVLVIIMVMLMVMDMDTEATTTTIINTFYLDN